MSEEGHHPAAVSPVEQRVAALEALLTERGLVPEGFIEEITRRYESQIGPMNGARVVARAWTDPGYRRRLLADGTAAIAELCFGGPEGDHMVVVEDPPVPGPDGPGAPQAADRDGLPAARRRRDPGVGLLRRDPLPRLARTPAGYRGHDRGGAGRAGHPGLDD